MPWWALATSVAVFAVSIAYGAFAGSSEGTMISQVIVSGTFVATGLVAWTRRPDNRMGLLMVLFGWCFMAIAFTKPVIPALVPVGLAGFVVSGSLLGYVMLAYPSGELRTTANRLLIAGCAIGIGVPRLVRLLATDAMPSGSANTNPLWLLRDPGILAVTQPLPYILDLLVIGAFLVVVVVRWQGASGARSSPMGSRRSSGIV